MNKPSPPSPAMSPTSAEIEAAVHRLEAEHPRLVSSRAVERTGEGRPILAVTFTDPAVPAEDKQHALILAGQHGDEESSRLVALALMDWLVSGEGAETCRKQRVVILPNVNPDGAERDTHKTPAGVQPNLDHGPGGAVSPEGRAVEAVAAELKPELVVDLHARGGAGCSYDMVLFPGARPYNEDESLLQGMAAELAAAGEAAGIPHLVHPLTWPGWGGDTLNEPSTTLYAYRNFKSLVFLLETCEHNMHAYPADLRARSGLAKLKALLAQGNRRHPWFAHEGYPAGLIGLRSAGLAAAGRTAAERRDSRIALWKQSDALRTPRPELPEQAAFKRLRFGNDGPDLNVSVGVQFRCGGHRPVRRVTLDGRALSASGTDGYTTWQDACSTFVLATLSGLPRGDHEMVLEFE
jgi:hypothetical protein